MAHACMEGQVDTAKQLLLENKAELFKSSVKWTDKGGKDLDNPPIFIAIDYDYLEIVRAFLEAGAAVFINLKDENEYTPLQWASWTGRKEIVRLLIENGAKVDEDALDLAKECDEGDNQEVIDILLQHVDPYSNMQKDDQDAIMDKACRIGDLAMVQKMMESGYDYQKWKDRDGKYMVLSPMLMAVKYGHMDIVQLFVNKGIELNMYDTEIPQSAENADKPVIEHLIPGNPKGQ